MSKPTRKTGPRDPERTMSLILGAARGAFARHGLDGARVDQIAALAGVNKRMIYYYFTDKEGLFLATLEELYKEISEAARDIVLVKDPQEALAGYVATTFRYYLAHPETVAILNNENLYEARHLKHSKVVPELKARFVDKLDDVLQRGMAQGVFRPGLDTVTVYITILALVYLYVGNNATLSVYFGRDLASEEARNAWLKHIQTSVREIVAPKPA